MAGRQGGQVFAGEAARSTILSSGMPNMGLSAGSGSGGPVSPVARQVPRLAAVVRGVAPRKSIMSRFTHFQTANKPVSVVPFAPERLSVALTPAMAQTLASKAAAVKKKAAPSSPSKGDDSSATTLFAALRMRRALRRAQAGHGHSHPTGTFVDDTQANMERHLKVLSRYRIRQVSTDADSSRRLRNLPPLMVNPHSTLYKLWQLSTLVIIIYQSLMLPYALAFGSSDSTVMDIVMNSIFALDIVIGFNTPVATDPDEMVYITDRCEIAHRYLRGWFFFDLLACLPFDYMALWFTNGDSTSNLNVLGLLKALRIPRLLRLVRLLRVVKLFKMRPELRRWLQYSRHANLLRLVRLVGSFLVINHYVACVWYGLVMSEETRSQDPNTDAAHLYFVAFYQSLLIVMGQNIAIYEDSEYIFCILVMVVGAVLMAVVFGNVAILIANYYESQSSHQKKMEWLFASMNRMKLPFDLQNRINGYYQAMWERHGTLDGAVTAFIPELSRNLAYEVELFLRMDMINRAPIFQNCSAKVVQELVMELELQVFMPGDYVVVRGEVGNDMYFVQNGICEVTKDIESTSTPVATSPDLSQAAQATQASQQPSSPHTKRVESTASVAPPPQPKEIVLKTLGQGDYFGEIALLMNCKRTANVRAQVFSELCTLTRDVFESISMRYLEDRNVIEKFIMDKYDPSMLQAAMKQSQEVSMRNNGTAVAAAAAAAAAVAKAVPRPHGGTAGHHSAQGHSTASLGGGVSRGEAATAKLTGLLNKVLDRLSHLEAQLGKEAEDRRESECQFRRSLNEATLRFSTTISGGKALTPNAVPKHPAALTRASTHTVAFEPERLSQRDLLVTDLASSRTIPTVVDGVATSDETDEHKSFKRPQPISLMGSWRNLRLDSSGGSLRLRTSGKSHTGGLSSSAGVGAGVGVGVVGAGGGMGAGPNSPRVSSRVNSRRTSRSSLSTSSNDILHIDPSQVKPEPELRSTLEQEHSNVHSWHEDEDEKTDHFPSGVLDDLANVLDSQRKL